MKTLKFLIGFLAFLFLEVNGCGQDYKFLTEPVTGITSDNGIDKPVTIKVIYDNYVKVYGLISDWGYSLVIEGLDKEILFDTGANPEIFDSNFRKIGIDPAIIDFLVLSHEHGDHTGGITAFVLRIF
jgi:glyoxylase-like metal-dependent hydrolase (beta-lactamase superfamily II)